MTTATIDGKPFNVIPTSPYLVYSVAIGAESNPFSGKREAIACLNAIREARFPAANWPNYTMSEDYYPWLFVATPDEVEGWVYLLVKGEG